MKHLIFPTVVAALATGLASLEARTWTEASTGKQIEAEFAGTEGGKVQLRMPNGNVIPLDLSRLSPEDQAWVAAQAASGADWPQWRGPNQDDISPDTGLLKEWPEGGPEQLWVFDDAGMGYSGFAVSGGKLYTLGTRGGSVYGIALDANSGEEIWSTKFGDDDENGYSAGWGGGPRSSPSIADGKAYFLSVKGELACLDAESGNKIWDRNIKDEYGGQWGGWGYSESPLIHDGKLLVSPGGQTSIVALDPATGEEIWKNTEGYGKAEYATIIASEINGTPQYVKFFEKAVVGFDAGSGDVLWEGTFPDGRTAVIPTPIVEGNEVYLTAGYGAGGKLIRVGSDNSTEDVWVNKEMKNHHGGAILLDGHVYGFSDGPGLICQDWESGEIVWNEKNPNMTKGSIHIADGMIYALNEGDGALTLVEATPDGFNSRGMFILEPQSPNRNPQGKVWTHPVVIGGKLYLRDQEYIVCYDVKG